MTNLSIDIKSKLHSYDMDISFKTSSKRIGILGASGAGKSMLLKFISGIISPDHGTIKIDEEIIFDSSKKINIKPQKRDVAYMFQNYALFPNMTVRENIEIVIQGSKELRKEKASEYMKKFHIFDLADKRPKDLSGGQQQRVALARIMVYEPKVILLDEPFSALDSNLKDKLQIELEEMLSGFDGTIIMVSHSKDEIYRFSEELLIVDKGKIVEYGPTKKTFSHPKTLEGAKIIGLSNIMPVHFDRGNKISVPDLDTEICLDDFSYVYDIDTNKIKYIGIRDRDFELLSEGQTAENIINAKIEKIYEGLEDTRVYFSVIGKEKTDDERKKYENYISINKEYHKRKEKISKNVFCLKFNNFAKENYLINKEVVRISFDKEKLIYISE